MGRKKESLLRDFHEAKWDEPMIYEMSVPGERGILPPAAAESVKKEMGDVKALIPEDLRRKSALDLPEVGQMRVNRHYMRLSQEVMGVDVSIDLGEGTCPSQPSSGNNSLEKYKKHSKKSLEKVEAQCYHLLRKGGSFYVKKKDN